MPKKRRAKRTARAATDPRAIYATTSVPSARASERHHRAERDQPRVQAYSAAAARRGHKEAGVAKLAGDLLVTLVPTHPPCPKWIWTIQARQRCAWAQTQHLRLGAGSAAFALSEDLCQMIGRILPQAPVGRHDSSESSDSVDSDTDTGSDTEQDLPTAPRWTERRVGTAVAGQPFPFSGRSLAAYYTSCGIATETVVLDSQQESDFVQTLLGDRRREKKATGATKSNRTKQGKQRRRVRGQDSTTGYAGDANDGCGWGVELQQATKVAMFDADYAIISKLLDLVSATTGCRRGRLQAKHLLFITTSLPIQSQAKPTCCYARDVSYNYRMGVCNAALLRKRSAFQPSWGASMFVAQLAGSSSCGVDMGEEMQLLLFAPPAVSVIASTAAGEVEIQLDVDDDLSAFQRKLCNALAPTGLPTLPDPSLQRLHPAELQLMGSARHLHNLETSEAKLFGKKVCLRSILPSEYFYDPVSESQKQCRRLRVTIVPLQAPQRLVVWYGESQHSVVLSGLKRTSTVSELKAKIAGALATPPGSPDDQDCRHVGPFQLHMRTEAFDLQYAKVLRHGGGPTALERVQLLPDDSNLENAFFEMFEGVSGAKGRVSAVRILDRSK